MSRPAQYRWEVLGESGDPVPGNPEEVARLGRELRATADSIERQANEIRALASVENWKGEAAEEFRKAAEGAEGKLRKAFRRYDEASKALGTRVNGSGGGTEYASELHRAQEMADKALTEAEKAHDEKEAAARALGKLPADTPADDPQSKRLKARQDEADAALAQYRKDVQTAKAIRDAAAKRAADAIKYVIEHDGLKDSRWDKFKNWVSENSGWIKEVSKWAGRIAAAAGVLALVVGWIPVIGQALAAILGTIAIIAGVVSLAANLTLALAGEGSWLDVALDVIGIATFGIGRAAIAGARGAAVGAKALARTGLYQKAIAAGAKQNKAWKIANAGSAGAPRGSAHALAKSGIPSSALPTLGRLVDGFNPKTVLRETWDAGKSLFDPATYRSFSKPGLLPEQELSRLAGELRGLSPDALKADGVRRALDMFQTQTHVWAGSTFVGTGLAVSNTDWVDAWGRVPGLKDSLTAPVGGRI